MSFSFNFTAASRDEAKAKARAEMDKVVQQQPIHRNDQRLVLSAVDAYVDLCPEPKDGQVVNLNVSGSVTWSGPMNPDADIIGAGLHITAGVGPAVRWVGGAASPA